MRTPFTLFVVSTLLLLAYSGALVTSGQAAEQALPKRSPAIPVRNMSEESLEKLVNTNMSKRQITERFGNPDITMPVEGGFLRWDFIFAPDDSSGPRRNIASGLTVYWKEDKMIRWAPALGTTGGGNPQEFMKRIEPLGSRTDSAKTNRGLSFWVVSPGKIEGGRYIDTPELKKLGWVAKEPALMIGRLKSAFGGHELVNYDGKTPREEYRFDLTLLPNDAEAFQKLTEQNLGKQVLLMLGDEPIMAPRVNSPLPMGRFSITVSDEKSFQALRESLAGILGE